MTTLRTLLICDSDSELAKWQAILAQLELLYDSLSMYRAMALPSVANGYDLVLIDSGSALANIVLCQRLHRLCDGAILVFVYHDDYAQQMAAYDAGAAECIVKSIGEELLLAKVNAWYNRVKQYREEHHN